MVIMEENRGYAATLGSCSADRYFCSLAAGYATATSWYGIASLYEQHAFLVPVPFLGL